MTVRTLIVDDSPTMRAVIARNLSQSPDIEVVGAADGVASAREMIKALNPDVITLDVEMPGMNGLDFLDKIMRLRPMPVVMLSTLTSRGADASIRALELGAFECVAKNPNGLEIRDNPGEPTLIDIVRAAARRGHKPRQTSIVPAPPSAYVARADAIIAIGSSTGGVEALIEVLRGFPADCPPTVIVQHMPATFTTTFAARLDRLSLPTVLEARSGVPLQRGHVYLAPGGSHHLEVIGSSELRCRLVADDPTSGHRPSVDRLFTSIAKTVGSSAAGAILTGMGRDGAAGLKLMRDSGAFTIGQDEASCVVYGMPQAAYQIGACEIQLPLTKVAARLLRECRA